MNDEVNVAFETLSDATFEALMNDSPPAQATPEIKGGTKKEDKVEPKQEKPKEEKEEPVVEKSDTQLEAELDAANGINIVTPEGAQSVGGVDEAEFFKAKAQGLIERGIWEEFDEPDGFEWNEENYGKLAETQAEWKAEAKYNERVGKTGDIGKTILEHIDAGGDPSEIIDLFKAVRKIENLDIKTDAGKQHAVTEYYTKLVGWSEAKTAKYVKTLVDSGDDSLTTEATEAKELMERGIQDQIKQTQEQQKQIQAQQVEQAKAWEANITKVIKERADLSDKDRKEVEEAILKYNIKLPDGRVVNKFMVEFMKLQADPQKYIDLVRFVTDPERYKEKVSKVAETKAAKKSWDLIKSNNSLSRNTGTSHSTLQEKPKNDLVIDYRKLL